MCIRHNLRLVAIQGPLQFLQRAVHLVHRQDHAPQIQNRIAAQFVNLPESSLKKRPAAAGRRHRSAAGDEESRNEPAQYAQEHHSAGAGTSAGAGGSVPPGQLHWAEGHTRRPYARGGCLVQHRHRHRRGRAVVGVRPLRAADGGCRRWERRLCGRRGWRRRRWFLDARRVAADSAAHRGGAAEEAGAGPKGVL